MNQGPKIKILIIGINYYPEDSAIGLYTTQKAEYLVSKGYEVSVITGFPYYPQWKISSEYKSKSYLHTETINDVRIYRSKQYVPENPTYFKRILHLISFTIGNFINLFRISKPDIVMAIIPFTTSALLGWFLKLRYRSKLWIHIQDFEFDAALQTGVGKKKNWIFLVLFWLEKGILSKADIVSTISQSMLHRLAKKTSSQQFYLPNWIDEEKIDPQNSIPHEYLISNNIKVLYSGNIGDKQDWDTFIQFCAALDASIYKIIVVGDGAKKEWLLDQIQAFQHVVYFPPVPYEELSDLLCSADLHVLFQKPDVIDTVMPSKVLGMMASACPSLIIGNEKSEVKKIFDDSKGGLYFTKYSSELINEMSQLLENQQAKKVMGKNARNYVIENYSKYQILSRMVLELNDL